jgi:hypothetical protein
VTSVCECESRGNWLLYSLTKATDAAGEAGTSRLLVVQPRLKCDASGATQTKKKPGINESEVPRARSSKKDDMLPENAAWMMTEKKNIDRPNPDNTIPVEVARYRDHGDT